MLTFINSICAFIFFIVETFAQGPYSGAYIGAIPRYQAVARLRTTDNQNQELQVGSVQFLQYNMGGPTTIVGVLNLPINGVRDQYLGLHIHTYGDVSEGCKWVGPHFNPHNQAHGGPMDDIRHVGDLGNIAVSGSIALINITDRQVQVVGMNSIIGRALVLHGIRDDLGRGGTTNSFTDGNSGYPFACGIIGIKGDFSPAGASSIGPCHLFWLLFISFVVLKTQW